MTSSPSMRRHGRRQFKPFRLSGSGPSPHEWIDSYGFRNRLVTPDDFPDRRWSSRFADAVLDLLPSNRREKMAAVLFAGACAVGAVLLLLLWDDGGRSRALLSADEFALSRMPPVVHAPPPPLSAPLISVPSVPAEGIRPPPVVDLSAPGESRRFCPPGSAFGTAYDPPPCMPAPPIEGRKVYELRLAGNHQVGFLGALGARLGIPTGSLSLKVDGEQDPRDVALGQTTVGEAGKAVPAAPIASRLLVSIAMTVVAIVIGFCLGSVAAHVVGSVVESWTGIPNPELKRSVASLAWSGTLLVLGMFLMRNRPDADAWEMLPLLLGSMAMLLRPERLPNQFGALTAVLACIMITQVPLVPPHSALASLYGPAGLYVWDFVYLGLIAVVGHQCWRRITIT